jgi:hypothetical protein
MKRPDMSINGGRKIVPSQPVPTGKRAHFIPEMKCSIQVDANSTPEAIQQRVDDYVLRYQRAQTALYKNTTGFERGKVGRG